MLDYTNRLLDYFRSNLKTSIPIGKTESYIGEGYITLKEEGVYFINGQFYSTYDPNKTEQIIIKSILTADSQIKRYENIKSDDLEKLVNNWANKVDESFMDSENLINFHSPKLSEKEKIEYEKVLEK